MNANHSPGPWKVGEIVDNSAFIEIDANNWIVVRCFGDGSLLAANQNVAAASPELLALLQDLWIWFKMTGNSENVQGKRFKERMLAMGYELP